MAANASCLFCRILRRELNADVVLETDDVLVFKDIHPKAKVHILAIPKKHITSLADAKDEDREILGNLLLALTQTARAMDIAENGYRTIINTRTHGGQEVDHLHVHLLGGEPIGPMRVLGDK